MIIHSHPTLIKQNLSIQRNNRDADQAICLNVIEHRVLTILWVINKDSIQMNSFSQGHAMHHKKSNFSSFASQRNNDKAQMEQEVYSPQPLHYHDIVYLMFSDTFMLALAHHLSQLSPALINLHKDKSHFMFAVMEILPITPHHSDNVIRIGSKFCLRNYQTDLYLCAQEELMQKFTNIIFKAECNAHCEFTFERSAETGDKIIYNREVLKIKSVASGLYLHIQQQIQDLGRYKHLWLTELSDEFKVIVLNRNKTHQEYLNNHDIVLLSNEISCSERYIGVSKHKNLYQFTEKKQNVVFDVNSFYYSRENCQIQYYNEASGRKRYFARCLWRVIKSNLHTDFSYLIKNKEEVYLQHVQTGLYLTIDHTNNHLGLQNRQVGIKIQNLQKFKTQFSVNNKFEPIHIKHPVSITPSSQRSFPLLQKSYNIERIPNKNYVTLYFSQILEFFDNLIRTMINPKQLNEYRQQLAKQSKLYVYIYRLLQDHIGQFEDQGYYFFQYTYKILQVLKIVLKDEKTALNHSQMAVRRSLLNPLITEIMKFISFIITINETFQKITAQDNKKTKEIIHTIFILYDFNFKYTLNLMITLSSSHPDLVVKLLSEKIYKAEHFQQRVELIEAIYQIIDKFRRINFNEENLKQVLQRQHKLIISDNCIYISFQRKQHSIFDIFQSISKFQGSIDSNNRQQKQTFYFYYYLLSITKILLNNKTQQLLQSQLSITESHFNGRHLIKKLAEQYERNTNINARMIILQLIYQITSEMYHKDFTIFSKLNFVVYNQIMLESSTPLSQILKISEESTLEWIFNKEQIIVFIEQILNNSWEKDYPLILKLKYFAKVINFLTATIITSSYDLYTLNLIQQFGIHIATIFYRKRTNINTFKQIRQQINAYHQKFSYLIIDGLKIYLDNLMFKLNIFFQAILTQKSRLYLYPIYADRQSLFCFDFFKEHYTHLIMNERIRTQIKAISSLVQLNQEKIELSGVVLNGKKDYSEGVKMIEKIIEDIDCLAIIMESFRLYGKDKELKQNIIAPMKLKILNIEDLLKNVYKNKLFHQCSDAFNLSSHLFEFILENSTQQQLILPLLQSLQERIMYNLNIFTLLKENIAAFLQVLLDPKSIKSARMILKWVGKQIQNISTPISPAQYEFLYSQVIKQIEKDFILNLIYLVNMLKEVGLHHAQKEQILYSKLINLPHIQLFISHCHSLKTFKLAHDKLQKDSDFFFKQYETSLELITLFRICETYPHLKQHLNNLLPFKEVIEGMEDHQQYFLYKPLLSYLIVELKNQPEVGPINLSIIFIEEHLSQFSNYLGELARYKVRDSLSKEKENKAHTHFCRTFSLGLHNNKSIVQAQEQKRYYWEFLMWVPFYHRPQGLLRNLQQIMMLILDKDGQDQSIEDNLQKIQKYLMQIKSLNFNFEEQRQFVKSINNIINLIKIHQKRKKIFSTRKTKKTQIIKTDQQIQQIYKILLDHDILKPFLCDVVRPIIKSITSGAQSQQNNYSSKYSFKQRNISDIQQYSENATLRDKTHHSLINPSENKLQQQSRFVFEELKFNLHDFFAKLKSVIPYKLKLYSRLYFSLLQYFERDGSLVMLQYKLKQQINNYRNRVTQYRQEEDENYQLYKRTVKGQNHHQAIPYPNQTHIQFGFQKIDMNKYQQLVQANQLKILSQILTQTHLKSLSRQNKIILPQISKFEDFLLNLMRLVSIKQYEVIDILDCCDPLLEIIIQHRSEDYIIDEKYQKQLYTCLSFFIFEMINTKTIAQNIQLYYKAMIFYGKIQFKYLKQFDMELLRFIVTEVVSKFPKSYFYYSREVANEMQIQMLLNSTKTFKIQQFSFFLQLMARQINKLVSEDLLSQNMDFYQNHKLLVGLVDLLQLYLRKVDIPKGFIFPSSILKALIQIQKIIYNQVFSKSTKIKNKQRIDLLQSLAIQLLSFFQTINLRKSNLAENSSLYLQRIDFLSEFEEDRQVYEFYQQRYEFCVLKSQSQLPIVQAYPKGINNMAWKLQFHRILSSYSDIDERKDIIFSYSSLAVQQQKSELKYQNFCHKIQPIVIILSTIIVSFAIIERFIVNSPKIITIWYHFLIIFNLVLLLFTIIERIMMIRKVIQLQIKIGKCESWYQYIFSSKKNFIFGSLFLIFINVNSIFFTKYLAFLFFIHLFSKKHLNDQTSSTFNYVLKIFSCIALLAFSFLFLFSLIINPSNNPSQLPLYNIKTNYDLQFMLVLIRAWRQGLESSSKIYYTIVISQVLVYIFMASIVFYYIQNNIQEKDEVKLCLLCAVSQKTQRVQQKDHQKEFHINFQHNIFKFISVFKYILKKEDKLLNLQQRQLKKLLINKNKSIFT